MGSKPRKYTAAQVIKALEASNGLQTQAAKILGCHRCTVADYIETYPTVKEAYLASRDTNIDVAEHALFKKINEGDTTAIIFYLKTVGKNRGYVERRENLNINVNVELLQRLVTTLEANDKNPEIIFQRMLDQLEAPDGTE